MPGSIIGYHKANLTKHRIAEIKYEFEDRDRKRRLEINNNQFIWGFTLEYLKKIDPDFDKWYDSDAVPNNIIWTGRDFQKVLAVVWQRINFIRGGSNDKAITNNSGNTRKTSRSSFK